MTGGPRRGIRQLWLPFPIRIHYSWVLTVSVVSALFAVLYFRGLPGVSAAGAAALGVVTSVLLLASVLVHELAHAAAAARSGLKVSGITLRVFGGATELEGHPRGAATELRIALAGPFMTLVLFVLFLAAGQLLTAAPEPVRAVTNNLALINGLLLAFNLIPAVPLDGGRILRAVLWAVWDRPLAATRAVAATGGAFGLLMVAFGILALFGGSGAAGGAVRLVLGAWFVLIGLNLRRTSREVTRQVWLAQALEGVTAAHLLDYRILSVPRQASAMELLALETPHSEIPVLDEADLVGAVRLEDLRRRSSDELERLTAGDLMRTDILAATLAPGDAAIRAVNLLTGGRRSLAVLDAGRFVGVVTMDTLRSRLSLRSDV
ncbi:MAG: CBS domain-containing protein [Acidobacteria bacterium]|nr:site-2 protease family protein [Acidobacteriota bacterium]MXZ60481.1 CBS domain-containing protein [Acidobacteriota bacterium]MYB32473.1 CBS domain-containing protein [Acidobacteriota bacterium]MYF13486.1 CBS domain-containing protein [Acidobacteriota bacterium]MYH20843.1 CBS domain-containing protein [Acidobacteriota bacterium]